MSSGILGGGAAGCTADAGEHCMANPATTIESYFLCGACKRAAPDAAVTLPAGLLVGKTAAARKKMACEALEYKNKNNAIVLHARLLSARVATKIPAE